MKRVIAVWIVAGAVFGCQPERARTATSAGTLESL